MKWLATAGFALLSFLTVANVSLVCQGTALGRRETASAVRVRLRN
jgi:hypothetical protein